jgi:hypothetical protein
MREAGHRFAAEQFLVATADVNSVVAHKESYNTLGTLLRKR